MHYWLACSLVLIGVFLFCAKRILRYLRFLQQDEYEVDRFLRWLLSKPYVDIKGSLACSVVIGLSFFSEHVFWLAIILVLSWIVIASFEKNPRKEGKKTLKMTPRAKEIYFCSMATQCVFSLLLLICTASSWVLFLLCQIIIIQLTPFCLALGCLLQSIKEKKKQILLLKEAKEKLSQINPFVIGITGSYGKTSSKDALSRMLQVTLGSTFWPPKGINTPMGITREIRSNLLPHTQYAVIEMGAYGKGSIKRLCDLTPPNAAIITNIGTAHLERFQTTQIILETKSELALAVPANGILVCNGDNAGARLIATTHKKKTTLLYGYDQTLGPLDCWISSYQSDEKGTHFTLEWKGKSYSGHCPLFGKPAISNVAGAFTMACALGADPDFVLGAIELLEPVDNRLQVQKEDEVTYLRDAYNSNPIGFHAALELMSSLQGNRRLLMTPGMIELGVQQISQHEEIGKKAAKHCDIALIVGDLNKTSLTNGLLSGGMQKSQIYHCASREEAFKTLRSLVRKGDLVLIENDLPDLHENQEKF